MATQKEIINVTKMSIAALGIGKKSMGKLCIILGKANGIKTGEDAKNNVWSALTGVFEGRVLAEGENNGDVFRSGKLFLPAGIHDAVEAAVKALPGFAEGTATGAVKFAMEIRRVEASNPIGYSYQAISILPMETQTDDLSDLVALAEARINGNALPAASPAPESRQLPASSTPAPAKEEPKPAGKRK